MIGKWDSWYAGLKDPEPFGDTITYSLGADWLSGCAFVEDWGCGKGWMRRFIERERYRGIDGSATPFADVIVDLAAYRSKVPGVFMRHVLEHNFDWPEILDNAVWSAQERLVVVLFTPLAEQTQVIVRAEDAIAPDISFRIDDILDRLEGFAWTWTEYATASQYGVETVILAERL